MRYLASKTPSEPVFAPVSVFAGGLVIALGNRLSAGLPPRFILVSSMLGRHHVMPAVAHFGAHFIDFALYLQLTLT